MRGAQAAALLADPPAGVAESLELIAELDDVLEHGLARLTPPHLLPLTALAAALEPTPLGERVREAVDKLAAGSVAREQLTALAAARAAVLGAVHDALLTQLDAALDRRRADDVPGDVDSAAGGDSGGAGYGPAEAAQAWLQELAIAGWRGLDQGHLTGADRPVEALLAEPGSRSLAVLLDGLAAELRARIPIAPADPVPARRWADLWTAAVLLAARGSAPDRGAPVQLVSGRLLPVCVDVLEHGTAVHVLIHAVLETATAGPRLVRTGVTAAKTDTISGPAIWQLFTGFPLLRTALAKQLAVDVRDLPLTAEGWLGWDEESVTLGEPADPFATARVLLPQAQAPRPAPGDRHPAALGEPVLVEGYRTDGAGWLLDGAALRVETGGFSPSGPLTPALAKASRACIGLLRHDGEGWLLRPLAVQTKSKSAPPAHHGGDWALGLTDPKVVKALSKSGDPVAVLRERAGRLLRR